MSRKYRIFQADAFTHRQFTGNPACVVLDAHSLSEPEMRAIAREMNKGDTAFVLPPASADEDLRVRFFSPRKEMPFVGHATLATHAVLSLGEPRLLRRQGGATGIVEVRSLPAGGGFAIRQDAPRLGSEVSGGALDEVMELLGLSREHLDPGHPARIAGTASTRLLIPLCDVAALDRIQPRLPALAALSPRVGAQGYFPFVLTGRGAQAQTESRMFCPALGIDEDPVSGNAHGMLGVYLLERGLISAAGGTAQFTGLQGRHLERDGRVAVTIEAGADGQARAATIAGQAVVVFESSLSL